MSHDLKSFNSICLLNPSDALSPDSNRKQGPLADAAAEAAAHLQWHDRLLAADARSKLSQGHQNGLSASADAAGLSALPGLASSISEVRAGRLVFLLENLIRSVVRIGLHV